jgi:hypothetical protein
MHVCMHAQLNVCTYYITAQHEHPLEPEDFSPPLIRVVFDALETTPELAEFKSSAPPVCMCVCMYVCVYV